MHSHVSLNPAQLVHTFNRHNIHVNVPHSLLGILVALDRRRRAQVHQARVKLMGHFLAKDGNRRATKVKPIRRAIT